MKSIKIWLRDKKLYNYKLKASEEIHEKQQINVNKNKQINNSLNT